MNDCCRHFIRGLAWLLPAVLLLAWSGTTTRTLAQPPMRNHTAIERQDLKLVKADRNAGFENLVSIEQTATSRIIKFNGIPAHQVGRFPNRGNPNAISARQHELKVPLAPKQASRFRDGRPYEFGIAVNGVLFDPGAGEFWRGNPRYGWQYEALAGAVPLGLDENYAHVQPTGMYHYHGLPVGLLNKLKISYEQHSPLVGWAADGFPIYALYGYRNTKPATVESGQAREIVKLKSSYRLKQGSRPKDRNNPGGKYDGTFTGDYEYVAGLGDLDEANGRFTITPEFPKGTYAYFLTENWPVVPRSFRGTPDRSFAKGGPGMGRSPQLMRPGSRRPGGR